MESLTDTENDVCMCVKDLVVPVMEDPVRSDSGYSGTCRCSGQSPYWEAVDKHLERETDQRHRLIAEDIHKNEHCQ